MIDKFYEWFEGTFENKIQAFSFPGRFAMVRVIHKRIGDFFYGEQAYNYQLHAPYRTFAVKPVVEGDFVRIQNYTFQKNLYKGFQNLDSLEGDLKISLLALLDLVGSVSYTHLTLPTIYSV